MLPAATAHRGARYPAVTMTAVLRCGRSGPCVYISVRPARLTGLTWWAPGTSVRVMLGASDHAGMLRISPDEKGAHRIYNTGGRWPKGDQTSMLRLPVLMGMKPAQEAAGAVEFDYNDTWLEIVLPAWARTEKPAALSVVQASPAPAAQHRTPFRMGRSS